MTQTRRKKTGLALLRWPNRLTIEQTKKLTRSLVAKYGLKKDAAAAAGVSCVTFNRWERGIDRAPRALSKLVAKRAAR